MSIPDNDYQILKLTNVFYRSYPNPPYKEILKFLFCVVFCLFTNDISSSSSKVFTSLCKIYLISQFLCVIYKSYKRVS